jgi:hypothetical protein
VVHSNPINHAIGPYSDELNPIHILTVWYIRPFVILTASISPRKLLQCDVNVLGHKENGNGRNNEQYTFNVNYDCTLFYPNFEKEL